jgi:gas vesicle protein
MARDDFDDEATVIVERRSVGVGAFLAGLAIGAGLALLMAPESGAELRRDLKRGARKARRMARDLTREARAKAGDVVDDARAELEARLDDARGAIRRGRREVVRAVDAGKSAARDARTSFERRIAETRDEARRAAERAASESSGNSAD